MKEQTIHGVITRLDRLKWRETVGNQITVADPATNDIVYSGFFDGEPVTNHLDLGDHVTITVNLTKDVSQPNAEEAPRS